MQYSTLIEMRFMGGDKAELMDVVVIGNFGEILQLYNTLKKRTIAIRSVMTDKQNTLSECLSNGPRPESTLLHDMYGLTFKRLEMYLSSLMLRNKIMDKVTCSLGATDSNLVLTDIIFNAGLTPGLDHPGARQEGQSDALAAGLADDRVHDQDVDHLRDDDIDYDPR